MKRIVTVVLVAVVLFAAAAPRAWAGSARQYRWEGAAIALGTIGLLTVLSELQSPEVSVSVRSPGYAPPAYRPPAYAPPAPVWVPGHWEWRRVWVPGGWSQVWMPGTSDSYGRYRPGRYGRHRAPGRYRVQKIWREGYYR